MEMFYLEIFRKYKSDWNYPINGRPDYSIPAPVPPAYVTFQRTMKYTLVVGQYFGLNPVIGVTEADTSKLRFTYFSWRFLYTVVSLLGQSVFVFFCFLKLFKDTDASLGSNTSIIFYTSNCLTTVLFLRIARQWPSLCREISNAEAADPNMDSHLIRKCNKSCLIILILALVEHILSDLKGVATAVDCEPHRHLYEGFVIHSFPWMFSVVPYNSALGFFSQVINLQCTFNWNFVDLFIICMSLYLASRLEQVNKRIVAVKGRYLPSSFWRTMREDYNRATYLVRAVDDIIGSVIFISFASNLFFICLQLLHTLADGVKPVPRCRYGFGPDRRPLRGYEQAVYFVYSFLFLVARSVAVSLTASRVHTASREPAHALYEVSSETYCVEIQRFLEQIHGDTVALSGLQFFNVKRGLALTIAATIVTYELVLMQFTGFTPTSPSPI